MCQTHGPTPNWLARRLPGFEFRGLQLEQSDRRAAGVHCEDHQHKSLSNLWLTFPWLWYGGAGLIVLSGATIILRYLGILPLMEFRERVFALIIIALTTIVPGVLFFARQRLELKAKRPPLPVAGQSLTIEVKEKMISEVELDNNGRYRIYSQEGKGQLDVSVQFGRSDYERSEKYRQRFGGPGVLPLAEVQFSAGFLAVRATYLFRPHSLLEYEGGRGNVLELSDWAAGLPFFQGSQSPGNDLWKLEVEYALAKDPQQIRTLPVQIRPSLAEEGPVRAVYLLVEVLPGSPFFNRRGSVVKLILSAPAILGNVREVRPQEGLINPDSDPDSNTDDYQRPPAHNHVVWQEIELGLEERKPRQAIFYTGYERSVNKSTELRGRLHVRFQDAALGIDNVVPFLALGQARQGSNVERHTDVIVDFRFHLAKLPFVMKAEVSGTVELERRPDHHLLRNLLDRLVSEKIYVKEVVEEPPRASQANAQVRNHLWDVMGRAYLGVYPIEVHLTATGSEVYQDAPGSSGGQATVSLTIWGEALNARMRNQIRALCVRLLAAISSLGQQRPASPPTQPPSQPSGPMPTPAQPGPRRSSGESPTSVYVPLLAEGEENP